MTSSLRSIFCLLLGSTRRISTTGSQVGAITHQYQRYRSALASIWPGLLSFRLLPYLVIGGMTHAMRRAKKPNKLLAHCVPSFSYMEPANSLHLISARFSLRQLTEGAPGCVTLVTHGNPAPKALRTTVVAERAEAADHRYLLDQPQFFSRRNRGPRLDYMAQDECPNLHIDDIVEQCDDCSSHQ